MFKQEETRTETQGMLLFAVLVVLPPVPVAESKTLPKEYAPVSGIWKTERIPHRLLTPIDWFGKTVFTTISMFRSGLYSVGNRVSLGGSHLSQHFVGTVTKSRL